MRMFLSRECHARWDEITEERTSVVPFKFTVELGVGGVQARSQMFKNQQEVGRGQ